MREGARKGRKRIEEFGRALGGRWRKGEMRGAPAGVVT
jgi:hypothetical protein